jgi:hypothetical protein
VIFLSHNNLLFNRLISNFELQKTQLAVCLRKQIPPGRDWALALLTVMPAVLTSELAGTDFTVIFCLLFRIKKTVFEICCKVRSGFRESLSFRVGKPLPMPGKPLPLRKRQEKSRIFIYSFAAVNQ